jgi:nitrite reductase/ring-hydroxylating ferredoxin subunit
MTGDVPRSDGGATRRGTLALTAEGLDLVIVRTASRLRACEGRCPHQGALLGEGEMDGNALVCRNHRCFDSATGEHKEAPAVSCRAPSRFAAASCGPTSRPLCESTYEPTARRTLDDLLGRGLPLVKCLPDRRVNSTWSGEMGGGVRPLYHIASGRIASSASPTQLNEAILRARPESYRRASNIEPVFREMGGRCSQPKARHGARSGALRWKHCRTGTSAGFYPTLQTVTRRLRTRWEKKGTQAPQSTCR